MQPQAVMPADEGPGACCVTRSCCACCASSWVTPNSTASVEVTTPRALALLPGTSTWPPCWPFCWFHVNADLATRAGEELSTTPGRTATYARWWYFQITLVHWHVFCDKSIDGVSFSVHGCTHKSVLYFAEG
jgi:hypothetical protein